MNQPIVKPIKTDQSRVAQIAQANVAMLATMHAALLEITRCQASLDGGVAMRYIAEKSLVAVQEIADSLEVQND